MWVFQEGHLAGLLGSEALGSLSITTPVLVAAIAFGLSMDYEVFLLGRITEAYRGSGDNGAAIDRGLARTGRIVTAAALLRRLHARVGLHDEPATAAAPPVEQRPVLQLLG